MLSKQYMLRAIELAKKGAGYTSPNPLVGAVIVKDDIIIGEGYHHKYGSLHAERDAINNCTVSTNGATIYVTLEPCCHYGKQPPCVDAIIESGITRVVVGSKDPNPLVAGKGNEKLRKNGIEVIEDFMRNECDEMNKVFFHYITKETPYVVMKYAMTIDGKIATYTGDSKWITGDAARHNVHEDRHRYTGIMVGIGTVLADNPMLDCRIDGKISPTRIICDTGLNTPVSSNIVNTAMKQRTIIATSVTDSSKYKPYTDKGCEVIYIPSENCSDATYDITENKNVDLKQHLNLNVLMKELGTLKIDSILLEGGGTLNWAALRAGIVNRVQAYIAPKIIGGVTAPTPVRGTGMELMKDAITLTNSSITKIGDDYLIESDVIY